ncbi:MAG: ribonuclease T2 family protein, partial [Saprospiraceae bacterium]
ATAAIAQRFPDRRPEARNVAGEFDYYVLNMSWSPSYCAGQARDSYDPQCDRSDGKRYSFVLHGLWPQYAPKGWPEFCPTRRRPFVPRPIINGMLDIMPSEKLVIHEYRKHGTCSGLEPNAYYDLSRKLFEAIKIPDSYRNPFEPKFVSTASLADDFMRANPWLKPDMFAVACGGPGNRLREIRFCFSKDGQPRSCTNNEDQRRLCTASRLYVPPVRATRQDAPAVDERGVPNRPKVIPNARNI